MAEALEIMEEHALNSNSVDWPRVQREVEKHYLAMVTAEAEPRALAPAFQALGDGHSHLVVVGDAQDEPVSDDCLTPSLQRQDGGTSILSVPSLWEPDLGSRVTAAYLAAGDEAVSSVGVHDGVIVDLRDNEGGHILPMLATVARLIGPGPLVRYRWRSGREESFDFDGEVVVSSEGRIRAAGPPSLQARRPLAVLCSPSTASSGEGVLLALKGRADVKVFGSMTAGLTTGNEAFPLSNGHTLFLTVACAVSGDGGLVHGPVTPDQATDRAGGPADVVERASSWLAAQTGLGAM